jgi:hypothetical protein
MMSNPSHTQPDRLKHEPLDLAATQRWLQSVIVHPDGVEAGIRSDAARRECNLTTDRVDEMITRSQAQSSIERLAVYSNAYKSRLLEVMIGEFPALVHAVGEEVFIDLANGYLEEHPPHSCTLAELSREFPDYLARTRPPRETENTTPDWADFLIDLARLERLYAEVFDGPGIEGRRLLQADDARRLTLEQWLNSTLIPASCLRLVTFHFPVHEYASAVRHQQEPTPPTVASTHLVITRRDYIVRRVAVTESEFEVLTALVEGETVHQALMRAATNHPGAIDDLAANLRRWFQSWISAGVFVAFEFRSPQDRS